MPRTLLVVLIFASGCKDCVGAQHDSELLPELTAALEQITEPDDWEDALHRFERDARIYRRPELANRVARLSQQAEMAGQPESLCTPVEVGQWIRAHLTRLRAELEGQPTTPVEPVLCGSAPRPVIRNLDEAWNLYGLDLNARHNGLRVTLTSSSAERDVTQHLQIQSPVRARVRLHVPDGLRFGPRDVELVLESGERVLSRLPLTDARPALKVHLTESLSAVAAHPTTTATVPGHHTLIGGGCRASFTGTGQLLIASYPSSPSAWTCRSKDHLTSDPSTITAFALSIPKSLGVPTYIATSTSPRGGHIHSQANLPPGYLLVGGGCRIKDAEAHSGHLLTIMKPGSRSYECEAKDHLVRSKAVLEAYALGVPDDLPFAVVREDVTGVEARRGHVSARLTRTTAVLVGGGCSVTQGDEGNLLWASFPRPSERRWVCAHKDHRHRERGTPSAFALGLRTD